MAERLVKNIKNELINPRVKILLVEDDEIDRQAMKRAFKKLKITNPLIMAKDGREALEYLQSKKVVSVQQPFLIILDLNMPRMNGHKFLEEIRKDKRLKEAVVFVLTTSSAEEDVIKSYDKNIAGYLVKGDLEGSFIKAVNMIEDFWGIVKFPPQNRVL